MIDIFMGCPVNKVVKGTDGAALMRNVELAEEIDMLEAVKRMNDVTVEGMSMLARDEQLAKASIGIDLSFEGRVIGDTLSYCLDTVIAGEVENNSKALIDFIKRDI